MAATRPPEMEDWLNRRIYHPLSQRLAAALASTPVTPNMVSMVSGSMIVLAGVLYVGLSWPLSVLLGLLAHLLWHVFDGADGDLARMTGKTSPLGEMIDGLCDYGGHFVLYNIVGIALFLEGDIGHWIWPIGYAAGLSRIVQSNHVESHRRIYLWRAYGVPWLKQARAEPAGRSGRVTRPIADAYVALAAVVNPVSERADRAMGKAAADPEIQRRARALCRQSFLSTRGLQLFLGPNYRTIALGVSMALGSPLWFFLYEAVLLNLVLVWSIVRQKRQNERLAALLEAELEGSAQLRMPST